MKPFISDHALVRYMERRHGFDFTPYRDEILRICEAPLRAGATKVSSDGMTFLLRDGAVRTVVPGETGQSSHLKTEKWKGRSTKLKR